jgi:hypothetical protein
MQRFTTSHRYTTFSFIGSLNPVKEEYKFYLFVVVVFFLLKLDLEKKEARETELLKTKNMKYAKKSRRRRNEEQAKIIQ